MKEIVRVTVVNYPMGYDPEIWVNQQCVFNDDLGDEFNFIVVTEAVLDTVRALGHGWDIQCTTCDWNDTTDLLASPFRVADSNGNDITTGIATFDEAVEHCETLLKLEKEDDHVLGSYEVINRFGNSVYRVEEGE